MNESRKLREQQKTLYTKKHIRLCDKEICVIKKDHASQMKFITYP